MLFLKIGKSALILEKSPVGAHLWVKISIEDVVL